MTGRYAWTAVRARIALAACATLLVGALALAGRTNDLPARAPGARPTLLLLTSLPLIFAEKFGLDGGGSPALSALEKRYKVRPVELASHANLDGHRLLLMAHPRAQTAEALVELDAWIRGGGRLLLLADARLDWPSERRLGDLLRPPPAFADTGLLRHWGLTIEPPEDAGNAERRIGDRVVTAGSPGTLRRAAGGCTVAGDGFVARCRLGRGEAMVVADADFLRVDPGDPNLDALLAALATLEPR